MDPPEEDVNALELASLIEETTNDHSSNNGSGSRPPLHPSRQQQFPAITTILTFDNINNPSVVYQLQQRLLGTNLPLRKLKLMWGK